MDIALKTVRDTCFEQGKFHRHGLGKQPDQYSTFVEGSVLVSPPIENLNHWVTSPVLFPPVQLCGRRYPVTDAQFVIPFDVGGNEVIGC